MRTKSADESGFGFKLFSWFMGFAPNSPIAQGGHIVYRGTVCSPRGTASHSLKYHRSQSCIMRVLRKSGGYVKNQTRKNLALAALSLLVTGAAFLPTVPKLLFLKAGLLEETLLVIALAALVAFYVYLRRYHSFRGGLEGERQVENLLKSTLNDKYYLLSDVRFRGGFGDIDHIVLGPNGLFVIETKNWTGRITCHGDQWQRSNQHKNGTDASSSPSRQVKKNASRVRDVIEAADKLGHLRVWVEGIVVFTNRNADLRIYDPTVPALRLHELSNFIISHGSQRYSQQQLETMGKEALKHTH